MKPKKSILLTNFQLTSGTWSETFLETLADHLKKNKRDVSFFCIYKGRKAKELESQWYAVYSLFASWLLIPLLSNRRLASILHSLIQRLSYSQLLSRIVLPSMPTFDLIHFQHISTVRFLRKRQPKAKKVLFLHWVLSVEESANHKDYPMDWYWVVSEEIENTLKQTIPSGVPVKIFRNPIDLKKFSSPKSINTTLQSVLVISKRILADKQAIKTLEKAVSQAGASLTLIGCPDRIVKDTRSYIENADVVIGLWRCAYEAMAMERSVIIYDYLWLDWLIDSEATFFELRKNNLSGRRYNNITPTLQEIIRELKKYDSSQWQKNRIFIETHNWIGELDAIISFYEATLATIAASE